MIINQANVLAIDNLHKDLFIKPLASKLVDKVATTRRIGLDYFIDVLYWHAFQI